MFIIHVRISYKSEILKDCEGLPVEEETKISDFFLARLLDEIQFTKKFFHY
jgi:hypothetical protein